MTGVAVEGSGVGQRGEGQRVGALPWAGQDVHDGHEPWDVADDPERQLGLGYKHGDGEDDAEEGEGVEGEDHLAQEEGRGRSRSASSTEGSAQRNPQEAPEWKRSSKQE